MLRCLKKVLIYLFPLWIGGFLILSTTKVKAQRDANGMYPIIPDDSITNHKNVKILFGFDSRFSTIGNQLVSINGVKVGFELYNKFRIGYGIYFLGTPLFYDIKVRKYDTLKFSKMRFNYMAFSLEYILYNKGAYEVSLPNQFGWGSTNFEYMNSSGRLEQTRKHPLFLYEPTLSGYRRIFYWVSLGGGGGYRFVLGSRTADKYFLNGPIFYFKVKFHPVEFFKCIKYGKVFKFVSNKHLF
jgi:hypothetical protein